MFLSIKELEVRRIRFDESFEPGKIDFSGSELRQAGQLHTQGTATLLENTGGEIRVKGRYRVEMEADCDRCLARAAFRSTRASTCFTGRSKRVRAWTRWGSTRAKPK